MIKKLLFAVILLITTQSLDVIDYACKYRPPCPSDRPVCKFGECFPKTSIY